MIGAVTALSRVEPRERKEAFLFFRASSSAGEKPPSGPVRIAVWVAGSDKLLAASVPSLLQTIRFPLKFSRNLLR